MATDSPIASIFVSLWSLGLYLNFTPVFDVTRGGLATTPGRRSLVCAFDSIASLCAPRTIAAFLQGVSMRAHVGHAVSPPRLAAGVWDGQTRAIICKNHSESTPVCLGCLLRRSSSWRSSQESRSMGSGCCSDAMNEHRIPEYDRPFGTAKPILHRNVCKEMA